MLVAVGACVGDARCRLRREQQEHLLVRIGELVPAFLLGDEQGAHERAMMMNRRALRGLEGHHIRVEPERPEVAGQVADPQGARLVPQVGEQPESVRPLRHLPVLVGRDAGTQNPKGTSVIVDGREHAVGGVGQRTGAVDDLLQNCVEIKARADPQDRLAETGSAFLKLLDRWAGRLRVVRNGHRSSPVLSHASGPTKRDGIAKVSPK